MSYECILGIQFTHPYQAAAPALNASMGAHQHGTAYRLQFHFI
jgi:hypothetical protein